MEINAKNEETFLGRLENRLLQKNVETLQRMFTNNLMDYMYYDDTYTGTDDCMTFYQIVHNHTLDEKYINFTMIYVPKIDKNIYCYKDVEDILKEKQENEKVVLSFSVLKRDLTKYKMRKFIDFANRLESSLYLSVSNFICPGRKSSYLFGVSTIIIDLDTYNTEYEYYTDEELWDEMKETIDNLGIMPTMYVNSGNGRYLVFSFNNVNLGARSMQHLYTETIKKLIYLFKPFGADPKCSDMTRLFRIPGNINPKTGNMSHIVKYTGVTTTLSDLATAVGIFKSENKEEKIKKNKKRTFQLYYKSIMITKYTKVNIERDKDFNTLLKLRNYDIEGSRNIFFHLMSINCFYMGMSLCEVTNYLTELNHSLVKPYEDLSSVIKYANQNNTYYKDNYDDAVKYTNRRIVELLDITLSEQKHMHQFISQEEADKRKVESEKKRCEKKKNFTKNKKTTLDSEMLDLRYNRLMTNKEIAKEMYIKESTIENHIGTTPKFVTIGRIENKVLVLELCKQNFKNNQIAEKLNISIGTVKRLKTQLRNEHLL